MKNNLKKTGEKRLEGRPKKEISEMMSKVRKGKFTKSQDLVDCLNSAVLESQGSKK